MAELGASELRAELGAVAGTRTHGYNGTCLGVCPGVQRARADGFPWRRDDDLHARPRQSLASSVENFGLPSFGLASKAGRCTVGRCLCM